jgi:lipid-A-disaccharide synthase
MCAGEASGDALGSRLIEALRSRGAALSCFGMGGARMAALGFESWRDAAELGVVGFLEVLLELPRLFRLLDELAERAIALQPDLAVLIDMPDFNLRLARRLRAAGIPVVYYVAPTVWAWRAGRVRSFRPEIRRMLTLFPFETEIWQRGGVETTFVGHPLLDEVPVAAPASLAEPKTVALLPGSRRSELRHHLPVMLGAAQRLFEEGLAERFLLPVAPTLDPNTVQRTVADSRVASAVELVVDRDGQGDGRRAAIARSALALVSSGTATLETALLGRPQVIVYRTSWTSWLIGRLLIRRIRFLGLPNLIAGRAIAPELLQGQLTEPRLFAAARRLLTDERARTEAVAGLAELRARLGPSGASARAAAAVLEIAPGRRG